MYEDRFSVLKQQKCVQKQCLIVNNQISNQELESVQLIHTIQSPLSGNSLCSTDNSSLIKSNEKMIEEPLFDEQFELIFSNLDNQEYYRQTLVFNTCITLIDIFQYKNQNKQQQGLNNHMMDQLCPQMKFKLIKSLMTPISQEQLKFIHHNFTINIRALCRFIKKVIEYNIAFQSNDIIQYYDESIHINPISLMRCQDQKQTCYQSLKQLLIQINICENIQLILQILKDFENEDLIKLKSYQIMDKDIYKLKLQLINIIYKRMQI
ncbi:unnamed protein product [Paramecium primaurelia]|uniref:Uncharacterized protein n=1 Tax=Paramecium primaurelia TaxID=5886 RepID=A0A8S1PQQ3_PARPR|nr:unnamed protein product [Paramecium primaurelia]